MEPLNGPALARASSTIDPTVWLEDWHKAYFWAEALHIPDVQGSPAVKTFLRAIQQQIAPSWAEAKLRELIEIDCVGGTALTLKQYADVLEALLREGLLMSRKATRAHGTLGGRPGSRESSNDRKHHDCPCERPNHFWKPAKCGLIEYAYLGESKAYRGKLSDEERAAVKKRISTSKWASLRAQITKKGWTKKGKESPASNDLPNQVAVVVIDPSLRNRNSVVNPTSTSSLGLFATPALGLHPFSKSTVLNTCAGLHVVNDRGLLEAGSYKPSSLDNRVDSGITSHRVEGYGRRVMSGFLDGADGPGTVTLTLENVAFIPGFHVNIASERLMRNAKVWYSGFDCTLGFGSLRKSKVVKKLVREGNLVFLEYNPISSCLSLARVTRHSSALQLLSQKHTHTTPLLCDAKD
ncbi:reverse transcriptase domain protein [Colletotrichum tofieldiae]|nr:reverse transcriptase domain protein [Colletotrichum tofieldiae]